MKERSRKRERRDREKKEHTHTRGGVRERCRVLSLLFNLFSLPGHPCRISRHKYFFFFNKGNSLICMSGLDNCLLVLGSFTSPATHSGSQHDWPYHLNPTPATGLLAPQPSTNSLLPLQLLATLADFQLSRLCSKVTSLGRPPLTL